MDCKRIAGAILFLWLFLPCNAVSIERDVRDIELPVQISAETNPVLSMAVSRDGKYLVIASDRGGFTDLWRLSADPGEVILPEQLTDDPSVETDPAFSSDSSYLAYTGTGHDVKGDIFIFDFNNKGVGPLRLTGRRTADGGPCFSPSGDMLYFHRQQPGNTHPRIVRLDLDGDSKEVSVLETGCDGSFPSVSPDGNSICFISYDEDPSGNIVVFETKTKTRQTITDGPFIDFAPSWSGDGKAVFFSRIGRDTDRDGILSTKDIAGVYRVNIHDDNLRVYPVLPEDDYIANPLASHGRLFYISDRLSGIPNVWSLPENGMVPRQENIDMQLEFAEVLETYIANPYLSILMYWAVTEQFINEPGSKTGHMARAEYRIGKLYRKEKMISASTRVFNHVYSNYKDAEPFSSLSYIELNALEAEGKMGETADSMARERIVSEAINIMNGLPDKGYPIISTRAGIESAMLLRKLEIAERQLQAIDILEKIEKNPLAKRAEVAEALVLKAEIYESIGIGEQVHPIYMSIIHNYPEQTGPSQTAVARILNKTMSGMEHKHVNEKIDLLIRIAGDNRDSAPLLSAGALNRAGDIYFADDRWEPAKDVYRRALNEFPESTVQTAAARFSLAEILFREERFREALKLYEKEINLRPAEDNIRRLARQGYINKSAAAGEYLYNLGEVYAAQSRFKELVEYDDSIVEAHRGYIKCAASLNIMEKTLADYRAHLEDNPDDPVAVYCVGLCLTYLNTESSAEEARKMLVRAVNMNGQIEYFHQTLGYVFEVLETVYQQEGSLEKALESYKKAYFLNNPKANPENAANLLLNLGNTYFSLGRYQNSFLKYKELQRMERPFYNRDREILFYRRLGMAAFQTGENNESIRAFSKTLALLNDEENESAMTVPVSSDRDGQSVRMDRLRVEILDRLGLAFQEEGAWEKAGDHFEKAYDLNKKLGLTQNLAVNKRSVAYNQYRQSETVFGQEKESLLMSSAENFMEASNLAETYGVAEKTEKAGEGLINLDLQVALDKTGATSAGHGFSVDQEKRLAEAFTSRIFLELGKVRMAEEFLEKQIAGYKEDEKIADEDLFGVSLLLHRAGLIAVSERKYHEAFSYFNRSASLCLKMGNRVSTALNVLNMAHALLRDPGGENKSLILLSDLDDTASELLGASNTVSPDAFNTIYHNTMGVFWMDISEYGSDGITGAARKMEAMRKAVRHFRRGMETLAEESFESARQKLELTATLYLNMAYASLRLGESERAGQSFGSAIEAARKGRFPDLEWRGLAGLGRYDEAFAAMERVSILRAGCRPFEIIEAFSAVVTGPANRGDMEGAFNMAEYLSELERYNRTAFVFRSICEASPDVYMELYPRLILLNDLENRISGAKGGERDYIRERIKEEHQLVRQKTGNDFEKMPEIIRMIPDDLRRQVLILLGVASHAEMAARDIAAIAGEKAAGRPVNEERAEALTKEYRRLSELYIKERGALLSGSGNPTAGMSCLLGPELFEAMDVMDALQDGDILVRLFSVAPRGGVKEDKSVYRFIVDKGGVDLTSHGTYKEALRGVDETGYTYIVCEDSKVFSPARSCAFNSAHFIRSVTKRKPFKNNVFSLPPAGSLPGGYHGISEPLVNMNTLILGERAHIASSVPVRAGMRSSYDPVIDSSEAGRQRIEKYMMNKHGLSLAVMTSTEPGDIFLIGHLTAIYGCPSLLVPFSGSGGEPFVSAFLNEYKTASALDAVARTAPGKDSAADNWILLGYKGMDPEEAAAFASKRFAAYVKKGKALFDKGIFQGALGYFEDAVKIAHENNRYNKYIGSLYRYVRESAYKAGDIETSARYAVMLSEELARKKPDTADHAQALLYQGLLYAKMENYGQALPVMEEAVEIFEILEAEKEKTTAMANLGTVLENSAEYERALMFFGSAAASGKQRDKLDIAADQYRNMGRIYDLRLNRYMVAITYYQKALSLYKDSEDHLKTAESLLNIGRCYRFLGDFDQAKTYYEKAEGLAGSIPHSRRLMAEIIMEKANSAWFSASYEEAFRMQRKVLEMATEYGMPDVKVLALNTSGLIWWALGNNKKAMWELNHALTIADENKIRRDEIATTYNNIGLVFRETGQYQNALDAFDKALSIDREIKSRWAIAYDLRNKGLTLLRMGNAEQSLPLFKEAVSISHEIGNRVNEAKARLGLGMAFAETGNVNESEKAFDSALRLAREMSLSETTWRALYGLAQLKLTGQTSDKGDEAETLLKQAVDEIEGMRADLKIDKLKESFVANKLAVYQSLVKHLADKGRVEEAFEIAERSRARNFIDLLGNQQISMKTDKENSLFQRQAFLRKEIDQAKRLLSGSKNEEEKDVYGKRLKRLANDYDDLMLDIQAENPQLASFVSVVPLEAESFIADLDEGVVLLAYYILPDELFCWVVSSESEKRGIQLVRTPIKTESFQLEILDFRRRIQNLEPLKEQSERLYDKLIRDVAPLLGKEKKLGIIPHGPLHYLSFATLYNGTRYLVDDFSIFYLPSASIYSYTKTRRTASKNTKVLAIGNPDLGTEALDLPFAEHEVESIRWNFPDITVLTGEKASESWVTENISKYGIIHLATHGEFDEINPLFSAIMLSKGENVDGNLETSEVFGLNIRADMVVLSACQTGLGRVTEGDDVIGLNRAFFYAGTHTIVSSLWRVSDVSTAVLTKAFYRRYRNHDKADSLRLAVLHVKNRYPHPGYWGAFTLSGDYY